MIVAASSPTRKVRRPSRWYVARISAPMPLAMPVPKITIKGAIQAIRVVQDIRTAGGSAEMRRLDLLQEGAPGVVEMRPGTTWVLRQQGQVELERQRVLDPLEESGRLVDAVDARQERGDQVGAREVGGRGAGQGQRDVLGHRQRLEHVVERDLGDGRRRAGGRVQARRLQRHRQHQRVLLLLSEGGGRNAGQLVTYFERPLCDLVDSYGVALAMLLVAVLVPAWMARWMGAAPRQRGRSDACTLTAPRRAAVSTSDGKIMP